MPYKDINKKRECARKCAKKRRTRLDVREKEKVSKRNYNIKRAYGITLETYNILLKSQNEVCAICKKPERNKRYKTLSVDHDHKTGKIRGLLCGNCNFSIGLLNEDLSIINELFLYLKKHKS